MTQEPSFYNQHIPQSEYRNKKEKTPEDRQLMEVGVSSLDVSSKAVKQELKEKIESMSDLIVSVLMPDDFDQQASVDDFLKDMYKKLGIMS